MPRIPLPSPDIMTPEQRTVYDAIISGPRGMVVGPLRAALHNPELAQTWQRFGEVLRYSATMPKRLRELAIIACGRHWGAPLEFHIHAGVARAEGLDDAVIAAIRQGRVPLFRQRQEWLSYEFARHLLSDGQVPQPVYEEAVECWGVVAVVELTALVGYYSMVAMTLNAHDITLPEMRGDVLEPADGLMLLPPGDLVRETADA